MVANVGVIVALGITSFWAFFAMATTSFGVGILFQIGVHVCSVFGLASKELTDSTSKIFILSMCMMTLQAMNLRKYVNYPLAAHFILSGLPTIVIGMYILFSGSTTSLKRGLGAVLLVVALWLWCGKSLVARLPVTLGVIDLDELHEGDFVIRSGWHRFVVLLTGACSGFLGGLFGTGGPPMMVFVATNAITVREWRATMAMTYGALGYVRVVYVTLFGDALDFDKLPEYASMLIGAVVGLAAGNKVAPKVNRIILKKVMLVLLVLGGTMMCAASNPSVVRYIAVSALVALLLVSAYFFSTTRRKKYIGGGGDSGATAIEVGSLDELRAPSS